MFTVENLTEEELKYYNEQKEITRKDFDSEEEFLKEWNSEKGWWSESYVLHEIKNKRCFSTDNQGNPVYTFLEDERPTIKNIKLPESGREILHKELFGSAKQGDMVSIRPCGKEYEDKTYIGFYLGDFPLSSSFIYNSDGGIDIKLVNHNPAIFVPELKKIIFGAESWWEKIESEKDLKEITNEDIGNVWYIQLLKKFIDKKEVVKND